MMLGVYNHINSKNFDDPVRFLPGINISHGDNKRNEMSQCSSSSISWYLLHKQLACNRG